MKKNRKEILAKLNELSEGKKSQWIDDANARSLNRLWIKKSQVVALKILRTLRAEGKTQKDLALLLDVTPQQVNKWVKGQENFTFETVCKIENVLKVTLISTPVEQK